MLCSMSRKGDRWDNAPMESFFGSLKTETGDPVYETRREARNEILTYLEGFYQLLIAKHISLCG